MRTPNPYAIMSRRKGRRGGSLFRRFFFTKPVFVGREIDLKLRQSGLDDLSLGIRDGHTYDICLHPQGRSVGYVALRLGESAELYYLGHIGYRVDEGFRGHGYAGEAVRLLLPVFRSLGQKSLVITTDVDNIPSRRTCEKLGCVLERVTPVPEKYRPLCMMSPAKCRYILFTGEGNEEEEQRDPAD